MGEDQARERERAGASRAGLAGQRRADQAARAGGERARAGEREAGHPEAPSAWGQSPRGLDGGGAQAAAWRPGRPQV